MLTEIQDALPRGWHVVEPLKSGGQGAVFRGNFFGNPAAIKVFGSLDDSRRVDREIELLKQRLSPHLVRILSDARITLRGRSVPVVAYELLSGPDLDHYLTDGRALTESQIATIGAHVAVAIEALWQRRICHRDVKPGNIIEDQRGYVLVDVGIARYLDLTDITMPGAAPGTRGFMSPEQAAGRRSLTLQSDVFSLGITLFTIASRRHPFEGSQPMLNAIPIQLSSLRGDLQRDFTALVQGMMSFTPSDRPRNLSSRFERFI